MDLKELATLNTAVGRFLVACGFAEKPLSIEELIEAVAKRNWKRYTERAAMEAVIELVSKHVLYMVVDVDDMKKARFALTAHGRMIFNHMREFSNPVGPHDRFYKFFRISTTAGMTLPLFTEIAVEAR